MREVLVWGLLGGGLGGVEVFWEVLVWSWWGDFVWSWWGILFGVGL